MLVSPTLKVSEKKTIDNCFFDAKSPKQGVGEASVPSDNQRLCDGTGRRFEDSSPTLRVKARLSFHL